MRALLDSGVAFDGIVAFNDLIGLGAMRVMQEAGIRIPEDVAVVGFDDSSAALACSPPLTTVRQPVEEMAAEMARLLLRAINEPGRPAQSVIFQPTLVVRQSA
jgi:DNA-binding LacI/PurR family transcriptional regulator